MVSSTAYDISFFGISGYLLYFKCKLSQIFTKLKKIMLVLRVNLMSGRSIFKYNRQASKQLSLFIRNKLHF